MRRRGANLRRAVVGGLALLAGLAGAGPAAAFCRTSACERGDYGTRCSPAQEQDCGVALHWKEPCIGFSVQHDGSSFFPTEVLAELLSEAFAQWSSVDCGGQRPEFVIERQPDATCGAPEYNFDINVNRGNANVVLFRDEDWSRPGLEEALALTTLTFDTETGEIYDADIEINTADFLFTTSDTKVAYDLLSTLQHETGHFLGIAHSEAGDAVMFAQPEFGSIQHRELTTDDAAAICAVFPPGATPVVAGCSPMPHDFAPDCGQELLPAAEHEEGRGCSASPARTPRGACSWFIAASVLALARRRRHPPSACRALGHFRAR